jgi:hypothetical protein
MKRLFFNPSGRQRLAAAGIFIAILLATASCSKNETAPGAAQDDFEIMAGLLHGEVISSDLEIAEDEEGIALICKDKDLIVLEKIPSVAITTIGNRPDTRIIYSEYGVVIRDENSKETFLYVQNSPECRKKFESIQSYLNTTVSSSIIAGTVRWQEIAGTIRIQSFKS